MADYQFPIPNARQPSQQLASRPQQRFVSSSPCQQDEDDHDEDDAAGIWDRLVCCLLHVVSHTFSIFPWVAQQNTVIVSVSDKQLKMDNGDDKPDLLNERGLSDIGQHPLQSLESEALYLSGLSRERAFAIDTLNIGSMVEDFAFNRLMDALFRRISTDKDEEFRYDDDVSPIPVYISTLFIALRS